MTPSIPPIGNAIGRALVSPNNSSLCIRKLSLNILVNPLLCIHANVASALRLKPSACPYHTTQVTSNARRDSEILHVGTWPTTGQRGSEIIFHRVPSLYPTAPTLLRRATTQVTGNVQRHDGIPNLGKSVTTGGQGGKGFRIRKIPQLSRAKAKARRVTPSTDLIAALELSGQSHALPRLPHKKLDLSFGPAWRRLPQDKIRAMLIRKSSRKDFGSQSIRGETDLTRELELSLPRILASYLIDLHPLLGEDFTEHDEESSAALDDRISRVFGNQTVSYLSRRGFDAADVMTWAWILSSATTDQALSRLFTIIRCCFPRRSARESIPTFVFLFLLRREYMSAKSLKLCLIHAWDRLENRTTFVPDWGPLEATKPKPCRREERQPLNADAQSPLQMDEKTITVMVIRLLRHARQVWVPSVIEISRIISKHIYGSTSDRAETLNGKTVSRLTLFYNRALSLLSLPPPLNPYLSIPYRQRAQFLLINQMTQFNPPLPINKEGYLAVARIQLAHRKTAKERQWAELKSKSWPPWIEEKTGLDTEKGVEHGISRAKVALTRMKEAGYAPGTWGKVVDIFAGWDTDGSPTIQTRAQFSKKPREEDIWAARIKSTRTVNEAWACFLSWCDERLPPSSDVYFAIMEKLIYAKAREKTRPMRAGRAANVRREHALPGDGKEVFPEPVSPKEAIYLRSQPPSVDILYGRMCQDGIYPTGRFLDFLVSHAESIKTGLDYLSAVWRNLGKKMAFALAHPNLTEQPWDSTGNVLLRNMTDQTFTALLHLLCRFPRPSGGPVKKPLVHALRLLLLRRPKYRPAWNTVLAALAKEKAPLINLEKTPGNSRSISTWELMRQLVGHMKSLDLSIDGQGFLLLCVKLEAMALAPPKRKTQATALVGDVAERSLGSASGFIKSTFQELVGTDVELNLEREELLDHNSPSSEANNGPQLPSLLAIPHPSEIHAYVRVLGLLREHEELLALFHWMVKHSVELDAVANESSNGWRIRRRAIVAARVFLESSWERVSNEPKKANAHILEQVRMVVESIAGWGGWPSDEEVAAYIEVGKKASRLPA